MMHFANFVWSRCTIVVWIILFHKLIKGIFVHTLPLPLTPSKLNNAKMQCYINPSNESGMISRSLSSSTIISTATIIFR